MLCINDIIIIIINRTPLGFLRGELVVVVVVVCRGHFTSSIFWNLDIFYKWVFNFGNLKKKLPPKFGSWVLAPMKTLKMGFLGCFWGSRPVFFYAQFARMRGLWTHNLSKKSEIRAISMHNFLNYVELFRELTLHTFKSAYF